MIAIKGLVCEINDVSERCDDTTGRTHVGVISLEFRTKSSGPPLGVKGLEEFIKAALDHEVMLVIGEKAW